MAPRNYTALPTEIHSIIANYVCAGDILKEQLYKNALNLCLVSKLLHTHTLPIMHRHLFVTGRTSVNLLARTLREHPERARFVRHVLVSDQRWGMATSTKARGKSLDGAEFEILPEFAFTLPTTQQERVQRRIRMQSWLLARAEMLSTFEKSVLDIITTAAPRLHSLTIVFYSKYRRRPVEGQSDPDHENIHADAQGSDVPTQDCAGKAIADILALEYPQLRDLTVREESLSICRPRLKMPALQRLHLAGGEIVLPAATLAAAAAGCPCLSYMRWTISTVTLALAEALEWIFGVAVYDELHARDVLEECTVSASTKRAMRSLRHFDVQIRRRLGTSSNTSPPTYTSTNDAYLSVALEQRLIALSHIAPTFQYRDTSTSAGGSIMIYPLDVAVSEWARQIKGLPSPMEPDNSPKTSGISQGPANQTK